MAVSRAPEGVDVAVEPILPAQLGRALQQVRALEAATSNVGKAWPISMEAWPETVVMASNGPRNGPRYT